MKLNAFTKTFEGRRVLDFPGCSLEKGEIWAIIGSNGSGKSTLARIAAGAIPTDSGIKAFEKRPAIGYMPQKSYAFRMSALGNLCLGGREKSKAMEMLKKLGIDHLASASAKKLSGGETARMALGRVLMEEHELIILDEPTASLDMESTALSEKLIMDYCRENGACALWVTHSLAQARRVAHKVMFLSQGQLLEWGDAEKLLNAPEMEETKEFLKFYE
ncbi:MAG: amino acid ABC transporter ATP-binding protein [Oscillospiraceae bacterium]|nr:amino acid ABC transporter ATP-binding protein [Oscillospiraceae bacterium]